MTAGGRHVPANDLRAFRKAVARAGLTVERDKANVVLVFKGATKVGAFNLTRGMVQSVRPALAELRKRGHDVGDVG